MDDDFEKRALPLFETFRGKCSELNLLNAELHRGNEENKKLYDVYRKAYDIYLVAVDKLNMGASHQLVEIRSEIQALQAQLLDLVIEHMLGPRHPHERGHKHDDF